MARSFVRIDVQAALGKLDALESEVRLAAEDMSIEAANAGAQKMRELIESKGTKRRWAMSYYAKEYPRSGNLREGSSPGRVNTGQMRDSVGVRFERGEKQTRSAFGWIRNVQDYFRYQEYGFEAGGFRPPMLVNEMMTLRDSRKYVVDEVIPRLIQKYKKRITRGVYR